MYLYAVFYEFISVSGLGVNGIDDYGDCINGIKAECRHIFKNISWSVKKLLYDGKQYEKDGYF